MKRILLIEDDGAIAEDISNTLSSSEYKFEYAYSYSSAVGFWKEYNGNFDCIILDLNINPNGLPDELFDKYFPIQGMAVLLEICKTKINDETPTENEIKKIWAKTIVYSGYIEKLKTRKKDFQYYNSLTLIPKTGMSMNELIKKVENIIKEKNKNNKL